MNKTLVVIKPDGPQRNLIGKIISYYEEGGLKVVALKLLEVPKELVAQHYVEDEDYMRSIGEKAASKGVEIDDLIEYGRGVVQGLQKYITEGPVVAMVLEGGDDAVSLVRKITGFTEPKSADKGTIRGDLGLDDTFEAANKEGRPVKNLIHASGTDEEAQKEIKLWFPELN
jgi:nucleoside-diphosphate kinase